jgi:hypothetical protein
MGHSLILNAQPFGQRLFLSRIFCLDQPTKNARQKIERLRMGEEGRGEGGKLI